MNDIEYQVMDITYFTNMTHDEAWTLSQQQRIRWLKYINKRLKEESGDKTEYM